MSNSGSVSKQTCNNWLIDASLFTSALIAMLSGIYFLFFPIGGYQGGRNPAYNIIVLFTRHTWDNLHTWSGVIMIAVVVIHLSLHWRWVVNMTRRMVKEIFGKGTSMNARGRFNLWVNITIAISFLVTALSGVYFLFVPGGWGTTDPLILFTRLTWDMLHTWGAIVLILAAMAHFVIHWNWIVKVSRGLVNSILHRSKQPSTAHSVPSGV
jgi:Domain of unknown function (DUF4405)